MQKQYSAAPKARKKPYTLEIHNDVRIDPYYWLRERENKEVIDYLKAENNYLEQVMSPHKAFTEQLFEEMKSRIKQTDMSVPYVKDGDFYYSRVEEGNEYAIHCRKRESLDHPEEVLIDENERAKDHGYYALGGMTIAPNKTEMIFSEDTVGRRIYALKHKDLITGKVSELNISNTNGSATYSSCGQYIFYTEKHPETLRTDRIFRYKLWSEEAPVQVYHETDETFYTHIYKSKSKEYLIIASTSTVSSEYRLLKADNPTGTFKIFQPRERFHEYGIAHHNGHFYVMTNQNATNFRLMRCSEENTQKEAWEEVIPHREDVLLESIEIFDNFLVVEERKDALIHLRIIDQRNQQEHYISFDEEVYAVGTGTNLEFNTNTLRLGYASMTTPPTVLTYDMENRSREILKQQEVLGGFNSDDYVSKRLHATAKDGTAIPISIVHKKSAEINGEMPVLLYGYGSYGHSLDASFSSTRLSLLNRGFAFAIAHIRGGEELGRKWYENGRQHAKMNTFTDFIACAEELISLKYTNASHLYAMGGSAGGLLIGAVINMRPELFKGAIAAVPFVDVVTTMLDDTIPLTTGEYDEWGNPNEKEYYDTMKAYSPYDNVKVQEYPNLLVTTGLHDSQVQYWEPAKWVAKLRDMKTDDNLLLFHCEMEAGHGGKSGRFEGLKEIALEYTFLLMLEEMVK